MACTLRRLDLILKLSASKSTVLTADIATAPTRIPACEVAPTAASTDPAPESTRNAGYLDE